MCIRDRENAAPAEQVPVASEDAEDAGKEDADAGGELELPDEPEGHHVEARLKLR